ncbi:hypothetical protein AWC38_SpisGene15113 [Stylophora pistillata]|uniref:Uncharacterized protein n=1 Tax=Stylophora pistillata TaxID=50429 RepID=A0A2B4RTF5_STYPI|nr:hypothetical protein AWC38_SpisGene15113 [Stylophora pistillata]
MPYIFVRGSPDFRIYQTGAPTLVARIRHSCVPGFQRMTVKAFSQTRTFINLNNNEVANAVLDDLKNQLGPVTTSENPQKLVTPLPPFEVLNKLQDLLSVRVSEARNTNGATIEWTLRQDDVLASQMIFVHNNMNMEDIPICNDNISSESITMTYIDSSIQLPCVENRFDRLADPYLQNGCGFGYLCSILRQPSEVIAFLTEGKGYSCVGRNDVGKTELWTLRSP